MLCLEHVIELKICSEDYMEDSKLLITGADKTKIV